MGAGTLRQVGMKISAAQMFDLGPETNIQYATAVIGNTDTQSITLKTLTGSEKQLSSLFRLQGVRQGDPTVLLIDAYGIKDRDPVQALMAEPMSQTFCDAAAEFIAMAADHGCPASVPKHQPLASPLLHANQVIPKLKPNLRADHQQQQQH